VDQPVNGTEFYSFAAATIPVLFLTLAFQQRTTGGFLSDDVATALGTQRSRGMDIFRASYTLVVTLILIFGEAAALVGLVKGFPLVFHAGYIGWFILGALIVGGFGVVAPTLITQLDIILPLKGDQPLSLIRTIWLLSFAGLVVYSVASIISALLN
jgi:hypothetical protein